MRRILFWAHLGTGVFIGVLILFFSITGALLAYERSILHASDKRFYSTHAVGPNARRMPLGMLIAKTEEAAKKPVEMIIIHPDPSSPVEMQTADHDVFLADP